MRNPSNASFDADDLARGFPPPEDAAWRALAEEALRGAPLDTLDSRTEDGTPIAPLYRKSDAVPVAGRPGSVRWDIVASADDLDIARCHHQVLADLEGGASAVSLVVRDAPSAHGYGFEPSRETFSRLLEGVHLHMISIRLEPHPKARTTAPMLADAILATKPDVLPQVRFGLDPVGNLARYGVLAAWDQVAERMPATIVDLRTKGFSGPLAEADGRTYHEAGATPAQELAATIATANAYLTLGLAPDDIGFSVAVDQDQFAGIAKLRALRLLWAKVCAVWKAPAGTPTIHAETSRRMMMVQDPHTNILRATIACFAAGVGGANSIAVLPFTVAHGLPDAFARRVARNTQLVLQEEANLYKVADPAAGSGAFEALTDDLATTAWRLFQDIEAEGGIVQSLVSGALQKRIKAAAKARAAAIETGETPIIGTTKFALAKETPVEVLDAERWPAPTFKPHALTCEALGADLKHVL